jgi:ribose transport system ATP-binding protein
MSESVEFLLKARKICKSFPGVRALHEVDFDLKPGEVHVLMGENGAGKSTLIKIFSGAYSLDMGDWSLYDKPSKIESPQQAIDCGIATCYQEFNLIDHLTVAENIYLGRMPKLTNSPFIDKKKMFDEAQDIMKQIGIDINVRKKISELGVAQQQMVEIAKSLAMNARIYILDEPTAVLSSREIEELFQVIETLKEKGCGIIYISHRLEEICQVGDRITVLRDGEWISTVPASTELNSLIEMMVGRKFDETFPELHISPGKELLKVENMGRDKVFSDINLTLREGEIVGITGLVGAKRTEVLRGIYGADKIDAGTIYVEGKKVKIDSPTRAVQSKIALLPEDRKNQGLVLIRDVLDNIILPSFKRFSKYNFIKKAEAVRVASEVSERISIKTPSLKQKVENLSGGNQQKVVVARWLTSECKIFLFDEPTRGIDVKAKSEIYGLMDEIIKQGAGIIMVSSEMPEVMNMCNRLYVMKSGKIVAELNKEDYSQNNILKYALTGTCD